MKNFRYLKPRSVEELLKIKNEEGDKALLLAGGSNILVYIKDGIIQEGTLVDISAIEELRRIHEGGGYLKIGAATTITEIIESSLLKEQIPFLPQSLKKFANPLIRNKATIGGNIADASPVADTVPPLLVLKGEAVVASAAGERMIPLNEFFVGPRVTNLKSNEVILRLQFALPERGSGRFIKLGLRKGTAISVTSVAVWLIMEDQQVADIRIALGGVAPIPIRAEQTEALFKGERLNPERIKTLSSELIKELSPISDVRGSAAYRREVSTRLLGRAIRQCLGMEE